MFKKAKHIISCFFLLLFVFANTGFTIHIHSCTNCGKTSYGVLQKPKCCHKISHKITPSCCHHKQEDNCQKNRSCCKNEVFVKQLDKDYNTSATQKISFAKTLMSQTFSKVSYNFNNNSNFSFKHKYFNLIQAISEDKHAMLCVYII